MENFVINEYLALYVFCLGILSQSLFAARSFKDVAKIFIIAALCLIPAWFIPEPGDDKRFAIPLIWSLCYAFTFCVVFRKSLLPAITALVLVCYTLLLYYVLFLIIQDAPVDVPRSMILSGLVPGILVLLVSLSGMLRYRWLKICCFAWYLFALCFMIGYQWSPENLVLLFKEKGFSPELFVYIFFGGGAFLLFISHVTQILLLIPPQSRSSQRVLLDPITGPLNYNKEQAAMVADRFLKWGINKREWAIVLAFSVLLITNTAFHFIARGIIINLSIIIMFWLVKPENDNRTEIQIKPEKDE